MITTQNISDYIDAYFRHELTAEEEASLMNALNSEPKWKAEFEEQQQLYQSIAAMGQLNIRDKIKADIASGEAYKSSKTKYYYLIGAGFLITAGSIAFLSNSSENTVAENLPIEKEQTEISPNTENTYNSEEMPPQDEHLINKQKAYHTSPTSGSSKIYSDSIEAVDSEMNKPIAADSVSKTPPQKDEVTSSVKDQCEGITISFSLQTMPACEGEKTGSIALSGIKGGAGTYRHQVTDENLNPSGLSGLKAGVYAVKVTDKNGCSNEEYVMVEEKSCRKDDLKILFRTDVQEYVSIPVSGERGTLTIINQQDKTVYTTPLITGKEEITFDGYTDKGKLTQGVYLLEIEYIDGQQTKGYLTIY